MAAVRLRVLITVAICFAGVRGTFFAGVAKVNATPPLGVPLAGYNHGARRVEFWPVPDYTQYTTWNTPSQGTLDAIWAKALIFDDGYTKFCFVTIDAMGADGSVRKMAWDIAASQGFTVPFENFVLSASHSHSGPGAIYSAFGMSITPTVDLLVPEIQREFATAIADAMVSAQSNMQPSAIGITQTMLTGVTYNRRAKYSPYVEYGTIDPHLGVIRVDTASGAPMATLWNYAIHGVCFGPDNMKFSADVMGAANMWVEKNVGGVSMFINGDAGDVSPIFSVCCTNKPHLSGGPIIGKAIKSAHDNLQPRTTGISLSAASHIVPFGMTNLNFTLSRDLNCTHGGPLDLCSFCAVFDCDANIHLPSSWIEENPRFSALRITIEDDSTLLVSIPGEAIVELGWQIYNDTINHMGFNRTFLVGYSNDYMAYFTTANEYVIGGYEAELTLWGIDTAQKVRDSCNEVARKVAR